MHRMLLSAKMATETYSMGDVTATSSIVSTVYVQDKLEFYWKLFST